MFSLARKLSCAGGLGISGDIKNPWDVAMYVVYFLYIQKSKINWKSKNI